MATKRRPTAKQRLRAIAETEPDQGEAGTNYPGEVLIAPESIPLRVSVPGAPSPMEPRQADREPSGRASRRHEHRGAHHATKAGAKKKTAAKRKRAG